MTGKGASYWVSAIVVGFFIAFLVGVWINIFNEEDDFDRCKAAGGRWGEVTELSAEGRWFTYEGCSVEVP